jgi:SAM-dependent methyltransferase
MLQQLKTLARVVAPTPVKNAWGLLRREMKRRQARIAFEGATAGPLFLPPGTLSALMRSGYRPPDTIRYDPDGLVLRADEKVGRIQERLPLTPCRTCLELGCWDGMVLAALARRGHLAYGADVSGEGFDGRARAAGVRLVLTDASTLALRSASIDLVYSFASFEHFADPPGVVDEAWRVLKARGYLYLMFGPVYTSPYGLHAYRQIPVPYCQYLFTDADLRTYAATEGLPTAWPYVNGVSVTAYRRLWAQQTPRFEQLYYREHSTGGVGAELITRYPFCFRSKVPAFDDLFVSAVEICLQKR